VYESDSKKVMADTFQGMSAQFRELAQTLPLRANEAKKTLASTIENDLLQVTPVDTGQAVSNWQVTVDTPAEDTVPPYAPAREGYMKGVRTWTHRADPSQTRVDNASSALDVSRPIIAGAQPGQPIFITNSVDYIQALDDGHSSQAPALFVDRAIILGRDVLSRVTITD
jgi:hypothetical protein